jgi:hypothetical protein
MAPGHIAARFDKLRIEHCERYGRGPRRRRRTSCERGGGEAAEPPPVNESDWRALVEQAIAAGRDLRPARWTTILYSCAKLGRREPALVAAALRALSPPPAGKNCAEAQQSPLASLHGAALANLLWSLAVMGERPTDAWVAHFCAATTPVVEGRRRGGPLPPTDPPPPLNPHQHATLLWSLGAIRYRAPAPYVSALLSGMRSGGVCDGGGEEDDNGSPRQQSSSLSGLLPSELANACWASMLRLGFLPSARWRAALLTATYGQLLLPPPPPPPPPSEEEESLHDDDDDKAPPPSRRQQQQQPCLTDDQLACLIWSWSSVRVRPPQRWLARLALSLAPGQRRGVGASAAAPRRPGRAATMPSRQLSVLLCGLAKLGVTLPAPALDAVSWRVARLCSGGGGGGGGSTPPAAAAAATSPSSSSAPAPPLDDLAALCWALPRLARPDARAWAQSRAGGAALRALSQAALPRLPEARSARPLAQLLSGLAAAGHHPGVLWLKTHQNACAALLPSGGRRGGGGDGEEEEAASENRDRIRRALRALARAA